jgi:hypothetical protein
MLIQDDIIRRALNFFGLRGQVQHEYVQSVIPTINIGNLGQPTLFLLNSAVTFNLQLFPVVPVGETWKLIRMNATYTQSAGTTAPTFSLTSQHSSGAYFRNFPAFFGSTLGEQLLISPALNVSTRLCVRFDPETYLPENHLLIWNSPVPGDGTRQMINTVLEYQKIGERMVEAQ